MRLQHINYSFHSFYTVSLHIHMCELTYTHVQACTHAYTGAHILAVDCRSLQCQCLNHLPCPLKCLLTRAALIQTEYRNSKQGREGTLGQKLFGQNSLYLRHLTSVPRSNQAIFAEKRKMKGYFYFLKKNTSRLGDRWTCILLSFFPKWFILGCWTPAFKQGFLLSVSSGWA